MNRLRDEAGADPVSEMGLAFIRGVRPLSNVSELKLRVWSALERVDSAAVGTARPRMQALAIALGIVFLAGTAGAVISGRWIVPALQRPSRASGAGSPGAASAPRDRARSVRRLADAATLDTATADAPLSHSAGPAPAETSRRAAAPADRSAGKAPGAARSAASSAQERTEVLDALIALRRDHDPLRAGAMLRHYLLVHPRGALREEALVLAIEAADARGDRLQTLKLARSYQADYPAGRFQQFARNQIESNGSHSPSPTVSLDGAPVAAPAGPSTEALELKK
jgi:hypothetical protein